MKQQVEMAKMEQKERELELKDKINERDNEVLIILKTMELNASKDDGGIKEPSEKEKEELRLKIKELDRRFNLDKEKLEFEKTKHKEDNDLKNKISIRQHANRNKQ